MRPRSETAHHEKQSIESGSLDNIRYTNQTAISVPGKAQYGNPNGDGMMGSWVGNSQRIYSDSYSGAV